MDVIYGLIPSMIIIGIVLVVILFWAIKTGQFDDLEGDAHRILLDEDLAVDEKNTHNNKQQENKQKKSDSGSKSSGSKSSGSKKMPSNKETQG